MIAEAAADGEAAADAGADLFRRGVETTRDNLQAGPNTAAQTFERMTDQVTKVLGFTGPGSEELARRSSENLQAVTQAGRGAPEVSQELFGLAHERSGTAMDGLNQLVVCRSVQALVAAQSDLMRDNLQLAIDTSRRVAALSVRVADGAGRALQGQADGELRITSGVLPWPPDVKGDLAEAKPHMSYLTRA